MMRHFILSSANMRVADWIPRRWKAEVFFFSDIVVPVCQRDTVIYLCSFNIVDWSAHSLALFHTHLFALPSKFNPARLQMVILGT